MSSSSLLHKASQFRAGNIRFYGPEWANITQDRYILDIVHHGLKLNFVSDPPGKNPFEYPRSTKETEIIDSEIHKLIKKQVVSKTTAIEGDYFSNLFTTPKKDGSYRTILNLKHLNKECETYHFKMETLKQAIHLIRPGTYLASIDIKDAFYSIPIHRNHKRYLKFVWKGIPYQFNAMPNGYVDAMRIFGKILKPVFAYLREQGYVSVIYVDDTLLSGDSYQECLENVQATLKLLQDLGFVIHPIKSVLIPTQCITFLGFIFDTINMSITLTEEKKVKIRNMAKHLLDTKEITIRMLYKFLGNLTASFDGVSQGQLHYRHIEFDRNYSFKYCGGDMDKKLNKYDVLSSEAITEIRWWYDNIMTSNAKIKSIPAIDYIINTDASNEGWGASDGTNPDINGRWFLHEKENHINVLELTAIKFAIEAYLPLRESTLFSDNTTAISYINKKGGTKCMVLNDLAFHIWQFCINYNAHLSAAHIPGAHNLLADIASRQFQDSAEWALPQHVFQNIISRFGKPDIDLFASRLNHKLPCYASWKPDPESSIIDAMSVSCSNRFIYMFLPFSMMWPVLTKIK